MSNDNLQQAVDREARPGSGLVVAICIATCRRPDGLQRLLEGLGKLEFAGPVSLSLRLVVVDNDPERSAEAICQQFGRRLPWPLTYHVEPRPGIAPARNAALATVGRDVDFVAMLDDDEVPCRGWLAELLAVQSAYAADVVGGPVIPHFPRPVPAWVIAGGFFAKPRYPTGRRLRHAFTNNVLVRADLIWETGMRFEPQYALMGCEDRDFFQRIGMAGYRIVWADRAVVREWIPPERANSRWIIQRMFRVGNSTTVIEQDLKPGLATRIGAAARALVWLGIGLLQTVWGLVAGRRHLVNGLRHIAYSAGRAYGLVGRRYEEYRHAATAAPGNVATAAKIAARRSPDSADDIP